MSTKGYSLQSYRENSGQLTGFKNFIINGDFSIAQRGTSSTLAGYQTVDRWTPNTSTVGVLSREEFTIGQTDVPRSNYFFRMSITGSTSRQQITKLENLSSFAGGTFTLSYYARSSVPTTPDLRILNDFGTGGSPSSTVATTIQSDVPITTKWTKFTNTFTVPSIAGKTLGTDGNDNLRIDWTFFDDSTYDFDIAQVQLERGEVATEFERRPYGLELMLCQRYYETGTHREYASSGSTAYHGDSITYKVDKRTIPTLTIEDGAHNMGKITLITGTQGTQTHNIDYFLSVSTAYFFNILKTAATASYGLLYSWTSDAEL